ncbi:MAG TPA: hypothetical protein VIM12_04310 [Noviherbaspirillum sp.]|jgi:hypothetical protein|uniref:hypothetical protein n=1 Tax=Noviherbaspirillum sp. TaxID=1926288 RepID=UPI002F9552A2
MAKTGTGTSKAAGAAVVPAARKASASTTGSAKAPAARTAKATAVSAPSVAPAEQAVQPLPAAAPKKAKAAAPATGKSGKTVAGKSAKPAAEARPKKPKVIRDSFTMPEAEYAVLGEVKKACLKAGIEVKKSELLRVGVALLKRLDTAGISEVLAGLPSLKAGRPKKGK